MTTTLTDTAGAALAAWAAEKHPEWCVGGPGCGDVHLSDPVEIAATDGDGRSFVLVAAKWTDAGVSSVELTAQSGEDYAFVNLTADEAQQLAWRLLEHAALSATPGELWSHTAERVAAIRSRLLAPEPSAVSA